MSLFQRSGWAVDSLSRRVQGVGEGPSFETPSRVVFARVTMQDPGNPSTVYCHETTLGELEMGHPLLLGRDAVIPLRLHEILSRKASLTRAWMGFVAARRQALAAGLGRTAGQQVLRMSRVGLTQRARSGAGHVLRATERAANKQRDRASERPLRSDCGTRVREQLRSIDIPFLTPQNWDADCDVATKPIDVAAPVHLHGPTRGARARFLGMDSRWCGLVRMVQG